MKITIALLGFLLIPAFLWPASYFVSPYGDDGNDGSFARPWKTVSEAVRNARAGDTVFIRAGTYYETVQFGHSGTDERSIVFRAYQNEIVTIDGSGSSRDLVYLAHSNIEIHGIRLRNGGKWGVLIENCSNVTVARCGIRGSARSGIRVLAAAHIRLTGNAVEACAREEDWGAGIWVTATEAITATDNRVSNTPALGIAVDHSRGVNIERNTVSNTLHNGIRVLESEDAIVAHNEVSLACNGSYGECITIQGVDRFSVRGNEVHTSGDARYGGEGINLMGGSRNGAAAGNYVHDLSKVGIYLDAWNAYTHSIEVFDNVVVRCSEGLAIGSEKNNTLENVSIHGNVLADNFFHGIILSAWVEDGPRKNIRIFNNTVYNNGNADRNYCGGIYIESSNIENVCVFNNICSRNAVFQIGVVPAAEADTAVRYNLLDGEQRGPDAVPGMHSVTAAPSFVNPGRSDFRLAPDSPAIDAGDPDPRFDDPDGSRSDMGAFAYEAPS